MAASPIQDGQKSYDTPKPTISTEFNSRPPGNHEIKSPESQLFNETNPDEVGLTPPILG